MDGVSEIAILEVKIGDKWVEWKRIERPRGQQFTGDLQRLVPQTRVRIVKQDDKKEPHEQNV